MQYNVCSTCGAKDGRAGLLISSDINNHIPECLNCYDTRNGDAIVVHSNLIRTHEEIQKTMAIKNEKE